MLGTVGSELGLDWQVMETFKVLSHGRSPGGMLQVLGDLALSPLCFMN